MTASSRFLALIPVTTGIVCAALMFPHAKEPADVPLPVPNLKVVQERALADDTSAEERTKAPLPPDVRALGTALRLLHLAEAEHRTGSDIDNATFAVERAHKAALEAVGDAEVLSLRAVQLHIFLVELEKFERTGTVSKELLELSGTFVERARDAGWILGKEVGLSNDERRVLFKQWWNVALKREDHATYKLTLDEQRVLYALYLAHPSPSEDRRRALATARREAKTAADCASLDASFTQAVDDLRMKRVMKLATFDPDYPAAYARGVLEYRRGRFDQAASAFQEWIDTHPEGPWTGRARNHLLAALHVR